MYVTKTSLSRRTVLRGMGAAVALPLLDAMVPALTATQKTAANPKLRFGAVYIPNGTILGSPQFTDMWTPSTAGSGFEFSPILKPLGGPWSGEPKRRRACLLIIPALKSAGSGVICPDGSLFMRDNLRPPTRSC